jgi:hypothetical protein
MNKTIYTVYWLESEDGVLTSCFIQSAELGPALGLAETMRNKDGVRAVTMVSENVDQIGRTGVDAVVDGVLPDGQEYVYKTGRDRGR